MLQIEEILKDNWSYESFRPLQKEIIESVMAGSDTLALLPTGGGKSICYQVPALAKEGVCLVVSPLIALMKDQVENLKKKGILAAAIYSGMSHRQIVQTLKNVAYGPYKLLYVSPERLETSLFKEYLPALNINLIAVDEAHCISQWGYDFRPSYLKIAELRNELNDIPVLALTASATAEVEKDICEKLSFKNSNIFRQSYERKNLSYSVFHVDAKLAKLVDVVKKVEGSTIIYCKSRKRTQEMANLLKMHGISAHYYHAGLMQDERNRKQKEWIDSEVKVMACTNAFGMGIDKPDVRVVIHADIPDSLENYYQEAGRAGRDGKKSYAVLLHDERDLQELKDLHKIRYPSFEQIKVVYSALVNYLQIPSYTGEDVSYSFRFEEFIKNFKLNAQQALFALKALEQDGWIHFNDKSFIPSTVVFTAKKEQLYDFYTSHPQHELLLITLLRTYEGIFDFPAHINEKVVANLVGSSDDEVKKSLKEIQAFHIIQYVSQNEEPQIIFRKNRVNVSDLFFNLHLYNKRKEAFVQRVEKMLAYTKTPVCRSKFINNYFGDEANKICGICDNCLLQKRKALNSEEFMKITTAIQQTLHSAPQTATEIISHLKGISKEKLWQVIDFMQAENKIETDEKGRIRLKQTSPSSAGGAS